MASTWPLALNIDTHIPGRGAGDNVGFLWNFWWFRHAALAPGAELFYTTHLFAPYGAPLALHTHTALPAILGATVLRPLSVTTAHNVMLMGGLVANGLVTYLLCWHQVRSVRAAVLGGTIFAGSAYVSIHLLGHFNLAHAWVLPLTALACIRFASQQSAAGGALMGAAFAAAAYTDYYYFVYAAMFLVMWLGLSACPLEVGWKEPRHPWIEHALAAAIAVLLVLIVAIWLTGGFQLSVGPMRVSASRIRNPLAAVWILGVVWLLLRLRFSPGAEPTLALRRLYVPALVALGVATVLMLPLIGAVLRLVLEGDYVPPPQTWRSGPRGIDLLTMVLGNPLHGQLAQGIYARLGIDMMEQVAWIGIVPILLLILTILRQGRLRPDARRWMWIGAFFLLWSCGAYLTIAGVDTGLPLPQALARLVPVLSNARMPGRAVVMVQLAAAVLCAIAIARLRCGHTAVAGLIALVVLDGAVTVPLFVLPPADSIDKGVRESGHAVVELPVGVRDGFGETGRFDHRALVHQIAHERPIAGGFLARVPTRIGDAYRDNPALSSLLRISADAGDLPADLGSRLLELGITHVVVNTDQMPINVKDLLAARGLRLVMVEGTRELYLVGGAP